MCNKLGPTSRCKINQALLFMPTDLMHLVLFLGTHDSHDGASLGRTHPLCCVSDDTLLSPAKSCGGSLGTPPSGHPASIEGGSGEMPEVG